MTDNSTKKGDISILKVFNEAIKEGADSQEAFQKALTTTGKSLLEVSTCAVDLMKASDNGTVDLDLYAHSIKKIGIVSKIASVGIKALSSVFNTLIIGAISFVGQRLFEGVYNKIHEVERIRENIRCLLLSGMQSY